MEHKYGSFTPSQMANYKQDLHRKVHWMLIYKDSKCNQDYLSVDVNQYIISVLIQLNGLNSILNYPSSFVTLMSLIEGARLELFKEKFDYKLYRKILLQVHALIDKLPESDGDVFE